MVCTMFSTYLGGIEGLTSTFWPTQERCCVVHNILDHINRHSPTRSNEKVSRGVPVGDLFLLMNCCSSVASCGGRRLPGDDPVVHLRVPCHSGVEDHGQLGKGSGAGQGEARL